MTDVLVAGIGNIFFRDDGFGPAVARQLLATPLPEGVRVVDYGIRGLHLSYDLLDGVDALVVVDAVPPPRNTPDAAPGTVLTIQVDPDHLGPAQLDAHSLSPAAVFARLEALGGRLPPTWVVGCVPADLDDGIGLSDAATAAVPAGVTAVRRLAHRLIAEPVEVLPGRAGS